MLVTIVSILQIILCLSIIGLVLLQHGKSQGLSGSIAGGAETFFGKNKGRTIEAKLSKWTVVASVLFAVVTLILAFLG